MIVTGLVVRSHHRRLGSSLVALGALPGAAAVVLFWHPGFALFGVLSITVIASAVIDATRTNHAPAAAQPDMTPNT